MSAPASWTPVLPGLDDAARDLFANEAPGAAAVRSSGWDRYRAAPAPDPRSEEWSRTPIRRFPFARRRLAPPLSWREGRVVLVPPDEIDVPVEGDQSVNGSCGEAPGRPDLASGE